MTLEDELNDTILELGLAADRHTLPPEVARYIEKLREFRDRIRAGELTDPGGVLAADGEDEA